MDKRQQQRLFWIVTFGLACAALAVQFIAFYEGRRVKEENYFNRQQEHVRPL